MLGSVTQSYMATGELRALFQKGFEVALGNDREIVLSARTNFRYRFGNSNDAAWMRDDEESANRIWPALISVSLRDDKYGVASGIVWNVDLALAWTNISFPGRELAFWWRIHELPSPMRLLGWAKEWETQFVRKLS